MDCKQNKKLIYSLCDEDECRNGHISTKVYNIHYTYLGVSIDLIIIKIYNLICSIAGSAT